MAKTTPKEQKAPQETRVPTFAFNFYRGKDNIDWTGEYLRDGEVVFEITQGNSYQYICAVLERKMGMAVHQ